jgi:lipopolysaccharide export system protein LptC
MVTNPSVLTPVAPGPRRSDRPRLPWHLRLIELASAYLPLLLMALLALSTWWLVKNTPVAEADRVAAPLRHEPDYTMRQFMVQRFAPDGAIRAQIEGDLMRHYPDTDTLEVDNARIRHIGIDGRVTVATARRALSNGDGSEVQLQGGAHVIREAATADEETLEFRGEFLHAFLATERVRSHLPVTMTRGTTRIQADSMEYDNLDRLVQLKGRVQASFPPALSRTRK